MTISTNNIKVKTVLNGQSKKVKTYREMAIDLGNGFVKLRAFTKDGKRYELILPSTWAFLDDVGINTFGEGAGVGDIKVDRYTIGDSEYAWGEDVYKLDNNPTYGIENRYKSEAFMVMARIAMARVVRDCEISLDEEIILTTGLPSGESNTELEQDIRKAFLGEDNGYHDIEINDESYRFHIAHIEVLGQAMSAVVDRYLDDAGYVRDEDYEEIKVGVISIGAGTIDLDVVDALRRQGSNVSTNKGFSDVYKAIRTSIRVDYPTHASSISDYELVHLLEKRKYSPSRRKKEVDFGDAMDNELNKLVVAMQTAISRAWKDLSSMDEVLMTGASAKVFEDAMDNFIEGITIPENYDTIEVDGMCKWSTYKKNVLMEE